VKLAGAPITWGVCEVPGWGYQMEQERVLREIAAAGLTATELGPRGFLPENPRRLRALLANHGLTMVGGFVPAVLHHEDLKPAQLAQVEASARVLSSAGAEVLVLAAETGATGYESSRELTETEWATLARGIASIEDIAKCLGLTVAVHPHFGTVIESDADVRRFLELTCTPLCLDTGHLLVGGADPSAIATAARGRIAHVHLKDVDARMAARVRDGDIGYRDAVRAGMYRPLGEGDVNIIGIVQQLRDDGYDGWYVIEQDRVLGSGAEADVPLRQAMRSVQFLTGALAA
jgi:inosose dehydratase